jgi:hypothetical protein
MLPGQYHCRGLIRHIEITIINASLELILILISFPPFDHTASAAATRFALRLRNVLHLFTGHEIHGHRDMVFGSAC